MIELADKEGNTRWITVLTGALICRKILGCFKDHPKRSVGLLGLQPRGCRMGHKMRVSGGQLNSRLNNKNFLKGGKL